MQPVLAFGRVGGVTVVVGVVGEGPGAPGEVFGEAGQFDAGGHGGGRFDEGVGGIVGAAERECDVGEGVAGFPDGGGGVVVGAGARGGDGHAESGDDTGGVWDG